MVLGKPDLICAIPHWSLMYMMYSLFPFTRGHPVDIGWFYFTMIPRLMSTEGLFTAWLAAPLVIVWNWLGRDDPLPNKQQSERIPGLRSCAVHSSAIPWWRHQTEAFSSLLALCAGNSPATGEFPAQRASNADFDVGPHKLLNKQSNERWFETTWRSYDVIAMTVDRSHGLGKITHLQSASVMFSWPASVDGRNYDCQHIIDLRICVHLCIGFYLKQSKVILLGSLSCQSAL